VEKRQDISYSYGPESSTSNAFTEEDVTDDSGSKVSSDSIANGMSEGFRVSVADILEQGNYSPSHKHTFEVNDEFVHNKVKQRPRSHSHDSLQGSSKMADRTGDRYYGTPPKSLLGEHRSHTQSVLGDAYRMRSKAYPRSRSSFMAMTHTMSDDLQEENAFFSMSHALMSVLEEYKSFVVEQQLGSDILEPILAIEDVLSDKGHSESENFPINPENEVADKVSPPTSPTLYSENSCLFQWDPQVYQSGAHRCAHQLLTALSKNFGKDTFTANSNAKGGSLPLPGAMQSLLLKSEEISDALEEIRMRHAQRGTCEWAPPRQQIIFQIEPYKDLKKQMLVQEYRCAGCRMEVEQSLSKLYRYCYYHGKYFCQNCHSNKKAILPALVIHEWNFRQKSVSNIAYDLLAKIEDIPHYNISELNKGLYKRVMGLETMKSLRHQLVSTRQYIKTCRLATSLSSRYEDLGHLATDSHVYSLKDLLSVEKGELQLRARALLEASFKHVKECEICKYKGHYCEICQRDDDIIYPFEAKRVVQCQQCFACYHKECFMQGAVSCPKCVRLKAWKSRSDLS
jgi:run domain Beclin-1 interacting cysteine-rich containing protein